MISHHDDGQPCLLGGACRRCDRSHFPHASVCPWCGADDTREVRLSPVGDLVGWTSVTSAPPGYSGPVPYGFGIVSLPEGIEVVGRLTEPDPGALHHGQAMHTVVEVVPGHADGDDTVTWAFAPTDP